MSIAHITFRQVEALVAQLRALTHDPEVLHGSEDAIYLRVLKTIADGAAADPVALASEALKANDIEAPRWCT